MVAQRTRYRVMVRGEDGFLFCYRNRLLEYQLNDEIVAAQGSYPNANVFVERESYQ